jgi:hypothetical protein
MDEFQHEAILIPTRGLSKLKTLCFKDVSVSVLRQMLLKPVDPDQQRRL